MSRKSKPDAWRNAITRYADEAPESLLANPQNWRLHPREQTAALTGSLTELGWIAPVIVNETTQHVVDGHARIGEAIARGEPTVPVAYVSLTEDQERLALATFDPIAAMAGTDQKMLDDLLAGLATDQDGLSDLLESLASEQPKQLNEDDADLTPPTEPVTKPGDLWLLGEHRLLCGDSTKAEDVALLMDGHKVNVCVTSPPYAQQRERQYGGIAPESYVEWFEPIAANIATVLSDDGSFFLNIKEHCEDGQRHLYVKDLTLAHVRDWGWRLVDEFCWRKAHDGVPGGWNNRFKNAWEPVFHFSRRAAIKFRADAVLHESPNVFEYSAENTKSHSGSGLLREPVKGRHSGMARPSNVLEIGESSEVLDHSAPFPVGLPEFFIRAFSDAGDVIYDPFMGAGSTTIAAEQTERLGYGMEINPAYCDVIVRRWEKVTGKVAVRG